MNARPHRRLHAFKRELADFDRHFALQTDEGLRLTCHTPVVLADDFRWLGFTPESVTTLGASDQWKVRWTKQLPPSASEADNHDIVLDLLFVDRKFRRLFSPERFFALVPKPFLTGLVRSLGQADVDRSRRLAEVNFSRTERDIVTARVLATSLAMLLGAPTEQVVTGPRTTLRYRYTPVPSDSKNGVIDMLFTFDTTTAQLTHLQGRSPVGQVSFNFESPPTL